MIKTRKFLVCILAIVVLGGAGCVAGKVSQDDLAKQWNKLSNENLQKMFCSKTMSGLTDWTVFWSSDCRTGKLEVGPFGKYKTEYRSVEVLNDKYCTTADGSGKKNCYLLYEKDGKYLDINASSGEQSTVNIKDGIPERIQKELDAFSSR